MHILFVVKDGFVLVGSVTGHRYWSSMLHPEGTVTCGAWSPDDQEVHFINFHLMYVNYTYFTFYLKVYFGTSRGQMKVLDIHGTLIFQITLSDNSGISSMAWSCEKFCMNENQNKSECEYTIYLYYSIVYYVLCKNKLI